MIGLHHSAQRQSLNNRGQRPCSRDRFPQNGLLYCRPIGGRPADSVMLGITFPRTTLLQYRRTRRRKFLRALQPGQTYRLRKRSRGETARAVPQTTAEPLRSIRIRPLPLPASSPETMQAQ